MQQQSGCGKGLNIDNDEYITVSQKEIMNMKLTEQHQYPLVIHQLGSLVQHKIEII